MIQQLSATADQTEHAMSFREELNRLTIDEARYRRQETATMITECIRKGLRRLEGELHLVNNCYEFILQNLGESNDMQHVDDHINQARLLCEQYPDRLGLLRPVYENIKRSVLQPEQQSRSFYGEECRDIW